MAAAEAAAAKRKKILTPKPSVATVADPSLPAGVRLAWASWGVVELR